MAGITDIYPAEAQGTAGGFVILGRAGHEFTAEDQMLLQQVVVPQLIAKGVAVESMEMCEGSRSCMRFTVGTAEAKRKLLDMQSLAYTDQIIITFSETVPKTYSVSVRVYDTANPNRRPPPERLVVPGSPISLRPLAASIHRTMGLRFVPRFTQDRVALAGELNLRLECGCPEDANKLLCYTYGCVPYESEDQSTNAFGVRKGQLKDPWYGIRLSFYQAGIQLIVTDDSSSEDEGFGAMLRRVEPDMGGALIRRATDVDVSVVTAEWAGGQALVKAQTAKDYDVLVHGQQRVFAGHKLTFRPQLYPVN